MPITISLGTFDAEKFWRDENFAKLPELNDGSTHHIIAAMDELLFPLCGPGDLLLTRFAMSPVFKNYLEDIGFSLIHNTRSLQENGEKSPVSAEKCVFQLLAQRCQEPYFQELLGAGAVFNPYAILPHTAGAAGRFGGTQRFPAIESVKKVNSKIYSHELHDRLGLKKYGTIIRRNAELEEAAARIQSPKGFILKDPYGVSGKGNLVVALPGMLKRIEKHLAAQEAKGLQTCLLMEPYLDKVLDFSCQLNIDASGTTTILSIQNIYNKELAYVGSTAADTRFVDFLQQRGYFEIIDRLAAAIYHDGYFGDVCVDSMILKNDEIVPVVEINARKSMGLINQHLDRFLSRFGIKGYFIYFSTGFQGTIQFADILAKMADAEVLFSPARGYGVIPLSGNTLFINRDLDHGGAPLKTYKGRLYISAAASTHEKRRQLVDQTAEILRSLSFTIYK
jgi:hypothetical protein